MIFNILGFIFIFLIAILFIGLSIVGTVIRKILGFGRKNPGQYQSSGPQQQSSQERYQQTESQQTRKKVFDDDEGEYVEFEEVREEK